MNPNGYIVYEGPSMLDGAPIVAVLTGTTRASLNAKTGPMAQLWILGQTNAPHIAVRTGEDSSVCGDCKLRNGGGCYVATFQGPHSVWQAWRAGGYPMLPEGGITLPMVRLGAYGDPAAVPVAVLSALVARAPGHTGYTHAWRNPAIDAQQRADLRQLVMASCDTAGESVEARAAGWRTFRVRLATDALMTGEGVCPAAEESSVKRRLTCAECGACNGTKSGRKGHIAIVVHGVARKVAAFVHSTR